MDVSYQTNSYQADSHQINKQASKNKQYIRYTNTHLLIDMSHINNQNMNDDAALQYIQSKLTNCVFVFTDIGSIVYLITHSYNKTFAYMIQLLTNQISPNCTNTNLISFNYFQQLACLVCEHGTCDMVEAMIQVASIGIFLFNGDEWLYPCKHYLKNNSKVQGDVEYRCTRPGLQTLASQVCIYLHEGDTLAAINVLQTQHINIISDRTEWRSHICGIGNTHIPNQDITPLEAYIILCCAIQQNNLEFATFFLTLNYLEQIDTKHFEYILHKRNILVWCHLLIFCNNRTKIDLSPKMRERLCLCLWASSLHMMVNSDYYMNPVSMDEAWPQEDMLFDVLHCLLFPEKHYCSCHLRWNQYKGPFDWDWTSKCVREWLSTLLDWKPLDTCISSPAKNKLINLLCTIKSKNSLQDTEI